RRTWVEVPRSTHHSSPVTHHAFRQQGTRMNDLAETVRASMAGVPDLGYKPVPDVFKLPTGLNFGPCSGVAVNSKGNILVFNRSARALLEFDPTGKFLRTLAEGLFTTPHGLRVDEDDNIWVTDTGAHFVLKMSANGRILLIIG